MIIVVKQRESSFRKRYLLCLEALVDKATMMQKAKVKAGSYAGDLISNLHDEIFSYSLNLKHDYLSYYTDEYCEFFVYARKRFLFKKEVANALAEVFDKCAAILLFEPSYYFLEDEYGVDFLGRILELENRI